MGHPSPSPAVAAGIPSLTWPLIWLALTGYCVLRSTVGIFEDPANAPFVLAFSLGLYYLALCFYRHRIKQRKQWRRDRFIAWARKPPLPAPAVTDWENFEYHAARKVAAEERPKRKRAQRDFGGVKRTPPGTSNHGTNMRQDHSTGRWIKY